MNENSKIYYRSNPITEFNRYRSLFLGNYTNGYDAVEILINNFSLDTDYYIKEIFDKDPRAEYISSYSEISTIIGDFLQKCLMYGYCLYIFDKYNINCFSIECEANIYINSRSKSGLSLKVEFEINDENKIKIFSQYSNYRRNKPFSDLEIHTDHFLSPGIFQLCNFKFLGNIPCKKHDGNCFVYEPVSNIFKPLPFDDLPLYINIPFVSEYARERLERGPIESSHLNIYKYGNKWKNNLIII